MGAKIDKFETECVEKPFRVIASYCLQVLNQVTCCGYSFCQVCIKYINDQRKKNHCPCCKAKKFDYYPNKGSLYEFEVHA